MTPDDRGYYKFNRIRGLSSQKFGMTHVWVNPKKQKPLCSSQQNLGLICKVNCDTYILVSNFAL